MNQSECLTHKVSLQPSGWTFECREGETIMRAAERAGIRLPSSCRNGVCRACLCRVRQGQPVHYVVEWPGLSFDEKEEGWILPCVAQARSDLMIDAPGATLLEKREPAPLPLTGARRG